MIHIYLNGTRRGPFTHEQVQSLLRDGVVEPSDLASFGAEADLKPLRTLDLSTPVAPASPLPSIGPANQFHPIPTQLLGPYARSTLAPNETPVYRTSLHWIVFVRFAILALLGFLFLAMPFAIAVQALTGSQRGWFALPLPAFIMIPPTLAYISSELVISNARVLIKTGVIRRQTLEMFISKIESIAIDQGFVARFFDYGTVIVRGTGGFEEPFEGIAAPIEFRNWVQRMQKETT